jgi:hypothetical protein
MVNSPSRAWVAWSTGPAHVFSLGSAKMASGEDDRARESCGAGLAADLAGMLGDPPWWSHRTGSPLSPQGVTAVFPGEQASRTWSHVL